MTTQINQLTELTTTSDGDLLLIRENATGVDKKMQASNLRAKATTKGDVGLGDVDNVSAASLRDRSTHTGTQTLSTISDSGTMASQNANSVNIDGGTIDGTAVNATNLAYTGTLTGGTGVVNLGSGQVVKDASGNVGVGTDAPSQLLTVSRNQNSATEIRASNTDTTNGSSRSSIRAINGTVEISMESISAFSGAFFGTQSNHNLNLLTNGTTKATIDSSGHAIIPAGVTLGTSAGVYNAANTLDDYETGTWTPIITGSASNPSITYGIQGGEYVKIGKLVKAYFALTISSIAGGSGYAIFSLPFAPATNFAGAVHLQGTANCSSFVRAVFERAGSGGYIILNTNPDSTTTKDFQVADITTNTRIRAQCEYEVS